MERVYPDKRKKGYVLIEYVGYKISSDSKRIWTKALLAPRKPMYFKSYEEAATFRDKERNKLG